MSFIFGMLVGAAVVLLLPPKHRDRIIRWIHTMWQKVTKKG